MRKLRGAVQRVQEEACVLRVRAVLLQRLLAPRWRRHVCAVPGAIHAPFVAGHHRAPKGPRLAVLPAATEHLHKRMCWSVPLLYSIY